MDNHDNNGDGHQVEETGRGLALVVALVTFGAVAFLGAVGLVWAWISSLLTGTIGPML